MNAFAIVLTNLSGTYLLKASFHFMSLSDKSLYALGSALEDRFMYCVSAAKLCNTYICHSFPLHHSIALLMPLSLLPGTVYP